MMKPSQLARIWVLKEAAYKALPEPKPGFPSSLKRIVIRGIVRPKIGFFSLPFGRGLKLRGQAMLVGLKRVILAVVIVESKIHPIESGNRTLS